jgi:hypothetical protein
MTIYKELLDGCLAMRFKIRKAVEKYNTFRPHHALKDNRVHLLRDSLC